MTQPQPQTHPEPQPQARPGLRSPAPSGVSMRDLLASCAAATAVSTPPRAPAEPEARRPVREHREAA
ncbi:hypothetical protein [Streptomyces sp. AC512_CC834]|uniref:hypothetical protein n=1 Tax=Streptomyces sp. AC512_CC834 TaxID=2823691 RepID=UPI001C2656BD|nr:hypothetical protein [Streptomyces sp. AC512_CC834]